MIQRIKEWYRKKQIGEYFVVAFIVFFSFLCLLGGMWLEAAIKGLKIWMMDKIWFGGSIFDFLGGL